MRAATHSGMQAETVRLGAQACGDYGAPNIHAELRENGTRWAFASYSAAALCACARSSRVRRHISRL